MYSCYNCSVYIQRLQQYIVQQNQRISQIEQQLKQMQTEIQEAKSRPATQIDRIEYKFDQLKVETLEGTLNIGLNPLNGEQIEDFAVTQAKTNIPDIRHIHNQLINNLEDKMDDYLSNECPVYIENHAYQQRTVIESDHIDFIIEDIRKQMNERIIYYVGKNHTGLQDPSRESEIFQTIVDKLKIDIQNTINAYLTNLPKNVKEGENS